FLQAEDGIRDWSVTGVQTCALPISLQHIGAQVGRRIGLVFMPPRDLRFRLAAIEHRFEGFDIGPQDIEFAFLIADVGVGPLIARSEERRVGKEWRWRGCEGGEWTWD